MTNAATPVFRSRGGEKSPGLKLALVILIGLLLTIPLITVWALVYDRQSQSETARGSIVEGWGGPQLLAGPVLVIPYLGQSTETVDEGGKKVTKTTTVWKELAISPEKADLNTKVHPTRLKRSIYEAVVYEATFTGYATFVMPNDLARSGIPADKLAFDRAELRFGLSDTKGLVGGTPLVKVGDTWLHPEPGHGLGVTNGSGFFATLDARELMTKPLLIRTTYSFLGSSALALAPRAGDTVWKVESGWPSPSFTGSFLPRSRHVTSSGFDAEYKVGNLALGQSLTDASDEAVDLAALRSDYASRGGSSASGKTIMINLIQPIDLYSQVNRATKYGFLFIGFTFLAFLMFDIIGGVRVSSVEYLLVGAALVLFFVLLLAFAEVIGFTLAYLVASGGIIGLITTYSAAVLKSWRRAGYVAGLLTALYAVLYILLSLEAYSLLIGSIMLFAALAAVMYVTRHLDWGGGHKKGEDAKAPSPATT